MKNAEAAISSRRGSKKFEYLGRGLKNFRTGGGGVTDLGGYFYWGVSTSLHAMYVQEVLEKSRGQKMKISTMLINPKLKK